MNLNRSIACTGNSIDDPLHLVLAGVVEGKDDSLLYAECLVFVERVVASVVATQTLLAEFTIK